MVHHRYTIANTRLFTFDLYLRAKVSQNAAHYLLHHVTYAPAMFEAATSNGFGDAFTIKNII